MPSPLRALPFLFALATTLPAAAAVTAESAGPAPDGKIATWYTLTNAHGIEVRLLDFGATITSVETPDRDGKLADIVLGWPTLAGWMANRPHFGSTPGRFANRLAYGKMVIDGRPYQIPTNSESNGIPSTLHGGKVGFDKHVWTSRILKELNAVELTLVSPDGDQGFPGKVTVTATFILNEADELRIVYLATTDRNTVINLTNHSYWNLTGDAHHDILKESVTINAEQYLPMTSGNVPSGKIASVAGTPFDFRTPKVVGEQLKESTDEQLVLARGFDHCMILPRASGTVRFAARITDPESGRMLELSSDQPAVQFYTANNLSDVTGKDGVAYHSKSAICLEAEQFPNAPNEPRFPSAELRPGETYRQTMIWHFGLSPN